VADSFRALAATLSNSSCMAKGCLTPQETDMLTFCPQEPRLTTLVEHTVFHRDDPGEDDGWKAMGHADEIHLLQKDDHCWLKFAGMRKGSGPEVFANFKYGGYWNICGVPNVFAPLVLDMLPMLKNESWPEMAQTMSTCTKVTVSGASWGGGMAALLTSCATNGRLHDLYSKELPTFNVDKLYTFGGFPVSPKPLRNMSTKDGCFTGAQFFFPNDPIARYLPDILNHHKPLANAIRFGFGKNYFSLHSRTCNGHKQGTISVPHNVQVVSDLRKTFMLHKSEQKGVRESLDLLENWTEACLAVRPCGD